MDAKELIKAKHMNGIAGGGAAPTGDISITQNGTYDVTDKASAVVDVNNGQDISAAFAVLPPVTATITITKTVGQTLAASAAIQE